MIRALSLSLMFLWAVPLRADGDTASAPPASADTTAAPMSENPQTPGDGTKTTEISAQPDVNAPAPTPAVSNKKLTPADSIPAWVWKGPMPPIWRPKNGQPDLAERAARFAPPPYQNWALIGLETAAPVAASLLFALAGAGIGALVGYVVYATARDTRRVPITVPLGTSAIVALGAGLIGMFAVDAILSAGRPHRFWWARLIGFAILAPVPAALGAYSLYRAVGYYRFGPNTQFVLSILAVIGFGLSFTLLPTAALIACVIARVGDEFLRGPSIAPQVKPGEKKSAPAPEPTPQNP